MLCLLFCVETSISREAQAGIVEPPTSVVVWGLAAASAAVEAYLPLNTERKITNAVRSPVNDLFVDGLPFFYHRRL